LPIGKSQVYRYYFYKLRLYGFSQQRIHNIKIRRILFITSGNLARLTKHVLFFITYIQRKQKAPLAGESKEALVCLVAKQQRHN
jgi:hypothetical protein